MNNLRVSILISAVALASPALAVNLTFSADGPNGFVAPGQPDFDFEGAGGYLDAVRGLPAASGGSHLVPLERLTTQVRATNTRNGIYLPDAVTGQPIADGGTGVDQALTNRPPFGGGNNTTIGNGVATRFSVTRVGNVVTFSLFPASGDIILASDSRTSLGLVNAFAIRLRTAADSSISYTNLSFTDSSVTGQTLDDITSTNGGTVIRLFEGIAPGDFTLSGTLTRSWTGGEPNGSQLATQIKFLDIPPIPEASTWAMMIAGFGLVGSAMRRRRLAAA